MNYKIRFALTKRKKQKRAWERFLGMVTGTPLEATLGDSFIRFKIRVFMMANGTFKHPDKVKVKRRILCQEEFPVIAHEMCHYIQYVLMDREAKARLFEIVTGTPDAGTNPLYPENAQWRWGGWTGHPWGWRISEASACVMVEALSPWDNREEMRVQRVPFDVTDKMLNDVRELCEGLNG